MLRPISICAASLILTACGSGSGGSTSAPLTPPATSPITPAVAARASLVAPITAEFAWHTGTATVITLQDGQGAVIPNPACTSDDPDKLAISSDCKSATALRLGDHTVTVTAGGQAAKLVLHGVPARRWDGQRGSASSYGSGDYNLIVLPDATAVTWGANQDGVLGQHSERPAFDSSALPLKVLAADGSPLGALRQASAGDLHALALASDGTVYAWGDNNSYKLARGSGGAPPLIPAPVRNAADTGALTRVVQVEAGSDNSVALIDDGTVMSWSYHHGQGVLPVRQLPGQVKTPDGSAALSGIVAVAAGNSFSLALSDSGHIYAWSDEASLCGCGASFNAAAGLPGLVQKADGSVLGDIVAISAGYRFALALAADGSVWTFGQNTFGEQGQGTTGTDTPYAIQVKAAAPGAGVLANIVMVAAGGFHGLALDSAGKVWAWGYSSDGQLGDGPDLHANNAGLLPRAVFDQDGVALLSNVVSISAGMSSSTALRADGGVLMWGSNYGSALGQGDAGSPSALRKSYLPVAVSANGAHAPINIGPLSAYQNLLQHAR